MAEDGAVGVALERRPKRISSRAVPGEGEGGLFSQSWYPICLSSDVARGAIVRRPFLDGRVVVFRGEDGVAQVTSAYCPHLGADLSHGCVVGTRVRCALHAWEFERGGACVKTGMGEPAPPNAALFCYPTMERYGIVWAFNGESPRFSLPDLVYPDESLVFKAILHPETVNVDPWVCCTNPVDFQHLQALHGMVFDASPAEQVEWTEHSLGYRIGASVPSGDRIDFDVAVIGNNIFRQIGTLNGQWFALVMGFGLPEPGRSTAYLSVALRRDGGDESSYEASLDALLKFETGLWEQDIPIMKSIRFKPGVMAKSDKCLLRYFDYVRAFPRAHPGADFIR